MKKKYKIRKFNTVRGRRKGEKKRIWRGKIEEDEEKENDKELAIHNNTKIRKEKAVIQ